MKILGIAYKAMSYHLSPSDSIQTANIPEILLQYCPHSKSMTMSEGNDMDRQSCRIVKKLLLNLGVEASDEDLLLNRYIGKVRLSPENNMESLQKAEEWLCLLAERNSKECVFDARTFGKIMAGVWFELCYQALVLGYVAVVTFSRSKLSDWHLRGRAMMALAYAKKRVVTILHA